MVKRKKCMIGIGDGEAGSISAKLLLKRAAKMEVDETDKESYLR
jgi:hypothetical protein